MRGPRPAPRSRIYFCASPRDASSHSASLRHMICGGGALNLILEEAAASPHPCRWRGCPRPLRPRPRPVTSAPLRRRRKKGRRRGRGGRGRGIGKWRSRGRGPRDRSAHSARLSRLTRRRPLLLLFLLPLPVPVPPRRPREDEVRLQGGAPVREAPLRGREDPQEIPGPGPGDRREGTQGPDRRFGQEEIPGALRPHSRPILLLDPEANPLTGRRRPLLFCQQRHSPHQRHHGPALSGTPRGRLLSIHRLQRRKRLRSVKMPSARARVPPLPPSPPPPQPGNEHHRPVRDPHFAMF